MLGPPLAPEEVALRAAERDPLFQHLPDRGVQSREFVPRQRGCGAPRVNARQPQAFVGVAVAQACQYPLIQQHCFEYPSSPPELAGKDIHIE